MSKKYLWLILIFWGSSQAFASDTLRIEYCIEKALEQSPLSRQKLYYQSIDELKHQNIKKVYYPQLILSGQATYQSDVFSFPDNPGFEGPDIPKEQFNVYVTLQQTIYDGGVSKQKHLVESAQTAVNQQKVAVDQYQILSIINQLFFGISAIEHQVDILDKQLSLLVEQQKVIASGIKNGILLPSDGDQFRKQQLLVEQQKAIALFDRVAMLKVLASWIGESIGEESSLMLPSKNEEVVGGVRPEINYFKAQQNMLMAQEQMKQRKRNPQFFIFGQGGVGQPNPVNFLDVDPSGYYIVGVKMNWNILDYGEVRREKQVLQTQQQLMGTQIENFENNMSRQQLMNRAEVDRMAEMMRRDVELIALQERIVKSAYTQWQQGTINSTEYLDQLNEKSKLELQHEIHKVQWYQAQFNQEITSGNILQQLNHE